MNNGLSNIDTVEDFSFDERLTRAEDKIKKIEETINIFSSPEVYKGITPPRDLTEWKSKLKNIKKKLQKLKDSSFSEQRKVDAIKGLDKEMDTLLRSMDVDLSNQLSAMILYKHGRIETLLNENKDLLGTDYTIESEKLSDIIGELNGLNLRPPKQAANKKKYLLTKMDAFTTSINQLIAANKGEQTEQEHKINQDTKELSTLKNTLD